MMLIVVESAVSLEYITLGIGFCQVKYVKDIKL